MLKGVKNNLLKNNTFKKQPFKKQPFKKQPFKKRLNQNTLFMRSKPNSVAKYSFTRAYAVVLRPPRRRNIARPSHPGVCPVIKSVFWLNLFQKRLLDGIRSLLVFYH